MKTTLYLLSILFISSVCSCSNDGPNNESPNAAQSRKLGLKAISLSVSGEKMIIPAEGKIDIMKGDVLKIIGAEVSGMVLKDIRVNFRGFVADQAEDNADDRGYEIDTGTDLLYEYSLKKDSLLFAIEALHGTDNIGRIYIAITEPAPSQCEDRINIMKKRYEKERSILERQCENRIRDLEKRLKYLEKRLVEALSETR